MKKMAPSRLGQEKWEHRETSLIPSVDDGRIRAERPAGCFLEKFKQQAERRLGFATGR
jgi:hypothetical protein